MLNRNNLFVNTKMTMQNESFSMHQEPSD